MISATCSMSASSILFPDIWKYMSVVLCSSVCNILVIVQWIVSILIQFRFWENKLSAASAMTQSMATFRNVSSFTWVRSWASRNTDAMVALSISMPSIERLGEFSKKVIAPASSAMAITYICVCSQSLPYRTKLTTVPTTGSYFI